MSPFHFAVAVSMVCMIPMIFIPSFKRLSWLNLVGCISTVLVTVTMVLVVSIDAERKRMPLQVCWNFTHTMSMIHNLKRFT